MQINDLTKITDLADNDQFPVWDVSNQDTRRADIVDILNKIIAYVPTSGLAQARWVEAHPIAGLPNPVTLGVIPVSKGLVDVRIDGVAQMQDDFDLVGDQLTFVGGWPAGSDNVEIISLGSVLDREEAIALASAINTTPSYLRSDAVALLAAGNPYFVGLLAWFDEHGNLYRRSPGSTLLPGLNGFDPVSADLRHFGAIGDGAADDTTAVVAADASGLGPFDMKGLTFKTTIPGGTVLTQTYFNGSLLLINAGGFESIGRTNWPLTRAEIGYVGRKSPVLSWSGKNVLWLGTSIPAQGGAADSYPTLVTGTLGATVDNFSWAGSCATFRPIDTLDGFGSINQVKTLSMTQADVTAGLALYGPGSIFDDAYDPVTKASRMTVDWRITAPMIAKPTQVVVLDHAHNDRQFEFGTLTPATYTVTGVTLGATTIAALSSVTGLAVGDGIVLSISGIANLNHAFGRITAIAGLNVTFAYNSTGFPGAFVSGTATRCDRATVCGAWDFLVAAIRNAGIAAGVTPTIILAGAPSEYTGNVFGSTLWSINRRIEAYAAARGLAYFDVASVYSVSLADQAVYFPDGTHPTTTETRQALANYWTEWMSGGRVKVPARTNYTRAEAVTLLAAGNPVFAALDRWTDEKGNAYKLSAGATTLTGLPGFIPLAPYHLFQWGVVPIANDGATVPAVDYAAHIQAAHEYVAANGGGVIRTGAGTIGFGSTVYWGDGAYPVVLRGEGRGGISGSAVTTKASAGTRLRWIGAALGTGMMLTADRGNTGLKMRAFGGGLEDFMLDGGSVGGWGLVIRSHNGHYVNVHFDYWRTVHFFASCLSNGLASGPADNQHFRWNIHTSDVNASAVNQAIAHVAINGLAGANTSLGVIEEMRISCESDSVGAHFGNMDSIEIKMFTSSTRLAAVGDGGKLILHANDSFPVAIEASVANCRYNTFVMTECVRGITAKNGATPSGPNTILEVSRANGSPLPTIEAGALLSYTSAADGIRVPALLLPGQSAFSNYIAPGTSFAMELADASTAGNVSATAATASYARIGNMVFVSVRFIDISTAGLTAGNDVYLRGLPFTGSVSNFGGGTVYANSLTFTGQLTPILNAAAPTTLRIAKMTTGATVAFVKASDISTGVTDLFLNFWYFL